MKTSVFPGDQYQIDLEDLFREPRRKHSEHIVARVRAEMDTIANSLSPRWPVVVTGLEPGDYRTAGVVVDWEAINGPVAFFLLMLEVWQATGSGERRKAVTLSAANLLRAWETAIKGGMLMHLYEQLYIKPADEQRTAIRNSFRQLVLQGRLLDSGRRVKGEIVWVAASARAET